MSLDDLKRIAKLRSSKNYGNLSKEDLIYTILRSEKSLYENNYLNYIRNNTDDEIKEKINIIRIELAKLGDVIAKKDRDIIKKELYEIENKTELTNTEKDRTHNCLIKIVNDLSEKNKYRHTGYDDHDYYGIRDIELLYNNPDDYYRPILAKQAYNEKYSYYVSRGDKTKELSLKQCIDKVIPYLSELKDEKKNYNQKIQLDIGINFKYTIDIEKKYTFYIKSKNIETLPGDHVNNIIKKLTDSLFGNYEEQILILRNGSGYVYDNAEILGIHFHKIDLKRGSSYVVSPE